MNVSLILGHPTLDSFNHAMCSTAVTALGGIGHTCHVHDLYREGFDPVTPSAELAKDARLPSDIERHCLEIGEADGIIVIHPNW